MDYRPAKSALTTVSVPLQGDQPHLVELSSAFQAAQHPRSDSIGGCYDDRTEVQQVFGTLEETESEVEKLLDGVDIEELLALLPANESMEDTSSENNLSSHRPPSSPLRQPDQGIGLLDECLDSVTNLSSLSEFDQEPILRIHPCCEDLVHFIKTRTSTLTEQQSSDASRSVAKSVSNEDSTVLKSIKTEGDVEKCTCTWTQCGQVEALTSHAVSEALVAIYPEADQVMQEAVATTVQLSKDQRYTDWMERIEEDCDRVLASVGSFCQNLLQSAKNDAVKKPTHKENFSGRTIKTEAECQSNGLADVTNTSCSNKDPKSSKGSHTNKVVKKRQHIPRESSDILRQWLIDHADHPYPSDDEKIELCLRTNLTLAKLNQWLINGRRRVLASLGLHARK